jgi:hypothetical protein
MSCCSQVEKLSAHRCQRQGESETVFVVQYFFSVVFDLRCADVPLRKRIWLDTSIKDYETV